MNITRVIDLTHSITPDMPAHPYDDPAQLKQIRTLKNDRYSDHQLITGMHIGTHIDGPAHLLESSLSIANFPASHFIRPGVLIDARGKNIDKNLLENVEIKPDAIVLILTGHDKKFGTKEYYTNHPVITPEFAQELIARKINMLGIDLPSPDNFPFTVHKMLLQRNILIIENLTGLEQLIGTNQFTVAALPLRITTDSSPARVIALY